VLTKTWFHPDSDKLFCEEIDVGEPAPRQIASVCVCARARACYACVCANAIGMHAYTKTAWGILQRFFCGYMSLLADVPCVLSLTHTCSLMGCERTLRSTRGDIFCFFFSQFFCQGLRAHFTLDTFCPGRKVVVVTNLKGRHSQK